MISGLAVAPVRWSHRPAAGHTASPASAPADLDGGACPRATGRLNGLHPGSPALVASAAAIRAAAKRRRDLVDRLLLSRAHIDAVLLVALRDALGQRKDEPSVVLGLLGRRLALQQLDRLA